MIRHIGRRDQGETPRSRSAQTRKAFSWNNADPKTFSKYTLSSKMWINIFHIPELALAANWLITWEGFSGTGSRNKISARWKTGINEFININLLESAGDFYRGWSPSGFLVVMNQRSDSDIVMTAQRVISSKVEYIV